MILLPKAKLAMYQSLGDLAIALYADTADRASYTKTGEVEGQGYDAGGKTLQTKVTETGVFASDVEWPNSTITARSALIYRVSDGSGVTNYKFPAKHASERDVFEVTFPDNEPLVAIS